MEVKASGAANGSGQQAQVWGITFLAEASLLAMQIQHGMHDPGADKFHWHGAGTYVMRLKERLPVREVALHMGAIHGVDKAKKLQQLHFWKPTSWKASAGQPIINRMVQVRA